MSTANLDSLLRRLDGGPQRSGRDVREVGGERRLLLPSTAWWTMFVAASVALASSGYLAWVSFTASPIAGCGGDSLFDCEHVLHSRWSQVLSVPVSVLAVATHASVIGMLLWRPAARRLRQIRWTAIGFAALAAGAAALWFVGLQVFWLQHLCPYCLVAHCGGTILAVAFLCTAPSRVVSMRWIGVSVTAAMALLVSLQSFSSAPQTFEVIEHEPATSGDPTAQPFQAPGLPSPARSSEAEAQPEDAPLFDAPLFEAPPSQPRTTTDDAEARNTAAPATSLSPTGGSPSPPDWQIGGVRRVTQSDVRHLMAETQLILAALAHPAILLSGDVAANTGSSTASSPRTVLVLNSVQLNSSHWPILGSPDAELQFVELFDYTCPHCHRTHAALNGARKKYGDRLAVITLPVPLDRKCNPTVQSTHASHREACELAKLAIAFWLVDRDRFAEFHDYLFDSKPTYGQALSQAKKMVDEEKLVKALNSSTPDEYIAKHVSLYQKAGAGTIPKLLFPTTTTAGAVDSASAMERLIQQHLQ